MINSVMNNLPGMIEDADFKFKQKKLPRTLQSPEYPHNSTPING
jgi:hypothetical protein